MMANAGAWIDVPEDSAVKMTVLGSDYVQLEVGELLVTLASGTVEVFIDQTQRALAELRAQQAASEDAEYEEIDIPARAPVRTDESRLAE